MQRRLSILVQLAFHVVARMPAAPAGASLGVAREVRHSCATVGTWFRAALSGPRAVETAENGRKALSLLAFGRVRVPVAVLDRARKHGLDCVSGALAEGCRCHEVVASRRSVGYSGCAVSLSDVPPQLANLSVAQLRRLLSADGIDSSATATKIDLLKQLVAQLPPDRLATIGDDYKYAGRTSATWVRFDGSGIEEAPLRMALANVCGTDPFAYRLRPELDSSPRLIDARAWRDDKVVLTFGVAGRRRLIFEHYELREVSEDTSFSAIVRLGKGVVEVRTASPHAEALMRGGFLQQLAAELGAAAVSIGLPDNALDRLRVELGASLVDYTGLDGSGSPFRRKSVGKASDCPDLAIEPRFRAEYGGLMPFSAELEFVDGDGERVRLLVALRTRSLYFRTPVSEATIDRVFAAMQVVWIT